MKRKLIIASMLCIFMSGCALLRDLSNRVIPNISFSRVGIDGFGFNEATLLFEFDVDNPNPVGLTAKRYNYDFLINNSSFVSGEHRDRDRKSTRLNSSHVAISYAVFCLKKKKK